MAVTPLTSAQRAAVDSLVASGRLAVVPPDPTRAQAFIRQAGDALEDIPRLAKTQTRYNLAYDACHDVGEALLAAYGYRTTNAPGQHEALGRYLCAALDNPPADAAARRYDQLRRSRNQQRYQAVPVGRAEADLASQTAQDLFDAATARGLAP